MREDSGVSNALNSVYARGDRSENSKSADSSRNTTFNAYGTG